MPPVFRMSERRATKEMTTCTDGGHRLGKESWDLKARVGVLGSRMYVVDTAQNPQRWINNKASRDDHHLVRRKSLKGPTLIHTEEEDMRGTPPLHST